MALHDTDCFYVADGHALQIDGSARAQTGGILKVGLYRHLVGEQASGIVHQEDEDKQDDGGDHDGDPNAKLRPPELLLARHVLSQATALRMSLNVTDFHANTLSCRL